MSQLKPSLAVIDTNVLIYDTVEDSVYHSEAAALLDSLERWLIPTIVVHELVWFLKGAGVSLELAIEIVKQYLGHEKTVVVPVETIDMRNAVETLKLEKIGLHHYNDKIILAVAIRKSAYLATFDRKLRTQARRKRVKVLPAKLPAKK